MNKKLKIGVIFGGSSSEKEVSLEGGRNVYQKLNPEKYEEIAIFVDSKYNFWNIPETLIIQNTCADLEKLVEKEAKRVLYEDLKNLIDFAFIIGHGKYMEDGCLQGFLELQNIPYNGPGVLGAALGMDKYQQRMILESEEIDVPKYEIVFKKDWNEKRDDIIKKLKDKFGFPFVLKPSREGCSTAIKKVKKEEDIKVGLEDAFKWDNEVLAEEFLEGKEITISVLGNEKKEALPITETPHHIKCEYLTLQDKFLPGGAEMITPAKLSEDVTKKAKEIAVKVSKILNLIGYPRIDMFVTKDNRIVVLEPNTLPGITPSTMVFHQAAEAGMGPFEFIDKIIELGIEAHRDKRGPL